MAAVEWAPVMELESMGRRMRRRSDEFGGAPPLLPATDIYETDDEYVARPNTVATTKA